MHPLPENVSRASTFDIVERIRCEAKEGLLEFPQSDPANADIIKATSIGYDFEFIITEDNNATGGALKFNRPSFIDATKGFNLDLSASAARQRKNTRKFRVVEDLTDLYKTDCSSATTRANWVYPITGATGLAEVVRTYIRLERLTRLRTSPDEFVVDRFPTVGTKAVVFADVLNFETTLSAGVKPTLTLNAVAGSLKLTNASVTGSVERKDKHNVIVAMASDTSRDLGAGLGASRGSRKAANAKFERKAIIEEGLVEDTRTMTALVQKNSDARNRILIELQRLRNLQDDEFEAPRILGQRLLDLLRVP